MDDITIEMIIKNYINQQILSTSLGMIIVLMLLFIVQQAGRYISYIVSGKIATNILLPLLGVEIPYLLVILLPLSLYLGMFIVYSRLYAEHEMIILYASGWNTRNFLFLSWPLISLTTVIVLVLAFWCNPWLANVKAQIIANGMNEKNLLQIVTPKHFTISSDGSHVLYVDKINHDTQNSEHLFLVEHKPNLTNDDFTQASEQTIVVANEARPVLEPNYTDRNVFVAQDGFRYQGIPGQNAYRIIKFKKYLIRFADEGIKHKTQLQEAMTLKHLYLNYHNPVYAGELQWRVSLVLMPLVLACLVLPFSKVKPRQSRYVLAIPVIIIYIIYANLLLIAKQWVVSGVIPSYVGMWWVHGCFVALAFWVLSNRQRSYY